MIVRLDLEAGTPAVAEINNPGAVFPGTIGVISLVLSLYCFAALSVSGTGLALGASKAMSASPVEEMKRSVAIDPGFGGQSFLPEMLPKIRRIRAICAERGLNPVIEVDGGENMATAGQAAAAGARAAR